MHALDSIVFFDGYCILCNRFADIILKYDKSGGLHLSTIQGKSFKSVISHWNAALPDSIVYKEGEKLYFKSRAVGRVSLKLQFPWNIGSFILLIPKFVADPVYDFIAARRERLFGRRMDCRIPKAEELKRFLD